MAPGALAGPFWANRRVRRVDPTVAKITLSGRCRKFEKCLNTHKNNYYELAYTFPDEKMIFGGQYMEFMILKTFVIFWTTTARKMSQGGSKNRQIAKTLRKSKGKWLILMQLNF